MLFSQLFFHSRLCLCSVSSIRVLAYMHLVCLIKSHQTMRYCIWDPKTSKCHVFWLRVPCYLILIFLNQNANLKEGENGWKQWKENQSIVWMQATNMPWECRHMHIVPSRKISQPSHTFYTLQHIKKYFWSKWNMLK